MNLFAQLDEELSPTHEVLAEGAVLMRGLALGVDGRLLAGVETVAGLVPFRQMLTPGGFRMSVAMTSCGRLGWVSDSDRNGYSAGDPEARRMWPQMPEGFLALARRAAEMAGFRGFEPDTCLINRYQAGAKLGLHQDRHERDLREPIVSVSLGLPAVFQFGGLERTDATKRILLEHGDVLVWGGASRLRFHGVLPLKPGWHEKTGVYRYNLTFRRVR